MLTGGQKPAPTLVSFLAYIEPTGLSHYGLFLLAHGGLDCGGGSLEFISLILIFLPTSFVQLYRLQLFLSFNCTFQKACGSDAVAAASWRA